MSKMLSRGLTREAKMGKGKSPTSKKPMGWGEPINKHTIIMLDNRAFRICERTIRWQDDVMTGFSFIK